MVLGKLPVPGRPTILITVGQGPIALAVGANGVVWTFLLSSILSPLSPSLWETARYRLKYCLKGPLNPKQPTKQIIQYSEVKDLFFVFPQALNPAYSSAKVSSGRGYEPVQNNFQHGFTWMTDEADGSVVLAVL